MKNKKNRREFLQNLSLISLAAGAAALPITSLAETPEKNQIEEEHKVVADPPDFIIDSHFHYGTTANWVNEVVKIYRPKNVMACSLAFMKDMGALKEAIQSYPDVFIGYGRIIPDDPNAIREIETFKKNGFVGIKMHSPVRNWDDPAYYQLYRLCEEYRMHMVLHTGANSHPISDTPVGGSYARMRPVYLDTICRLFPRATVQGAHFGNPWYDEAAEAARWNSNLYFDVTGSTLYKLIILNKLERMGEVLWWGGNAVNNPHTLQGGPEAWEHIVFGADEVPSGLQGNIDRFQRMLDVNKVPAALRPNIWGGTIAKILGIDPKTKKFLNDPKNVGPRVINK